MVCRIQWGSVVALGSSDHSDKHVQAGSLRFMPSNNIRGVDFLRLSSFVVPSGQRPEYDPEYYKLTQYEAKKIKALPIDRIVRTVARAVRLVKAGVGSPSVSDESVA